MTQSEFLRIKESAETTLELSPRQAEQLEQISLELRAAKSYWRHSLDSPQTRGLELADNSDEVRAVFVSKAFGETYRVKVHNAVGAIGLDGLTLLVEPKIPLEHFSYIAGSAMARDHRAGSSRFGLANGKSFLDVLATWFIETLETHIRAGLSRDYQEAEGSLPFVRGKVRPVATARKWILGKPVIDSLYEEFLPDNPINRTLKAATSLLGASQAVSEPLNQRARRCLRVMTEIGDLQAGDLSYASEHKRFKRSPELDYALHILQASGVALSNGRVDAKTFLVPTPALIESGIREILKRGLNPVAVEKRGMRLGKTWLTVTPDALIDRPPFTADVKYKITKSYWQRNDLAQAVMFAEAFFSDWGVVLSFAAEDSLPLPDVPIGRMIISSITWPVSENWNPYQAEQLVVQRFKEILAETSHKGAALVSSSPDVRY